MMGWKRAKNRSIGVLTSFLIDLTNRTQVSKASDISYLLDLPNLPIMRDGALTSSSVRILWPVCFRKTSSRLGLDRLIDESFRPLASKARTMAGTSELAFMA